MATLAKIPAEHDRAVQHSIEYLRSEDAMRSLDTNAYWPKWNSPWWHMTLLNEMGLAKRIPERAVRKMTEQLKVSRLKIFPIHPGDLPPGIDVYLESHCHCALGNIYQALAAAGLNVDEEMPWIREWFLRYQLPDGGLNCDNDAYLKDPPPSSMVGTISPLEAVLYYTPRDFTSDEIHFLDHGAQCLMERQLMRATTNPHNIEEREDEKDWLKLCFPRFYFYDVLRGLIFILRWANKREQTLSRNAISTVTKHFEKSFPDGDVRIGRHSFEGTGTRILGSDGKWLRQQQATHFPILDQVSRIGDVSPYLTGQWQEAKALMNSLSQQGLLK